MEASSTQRATVLNYKKAMQSPDTDEWCKEIRKEMERFNTYDTLTLVLRSSILKNLKVLTTTGHSR